MRKETNHLGVLLGLTSLPQKEQEDLLAAHADIIFEGIMLRTVPRIPEEFLPQFQKMLAGKDGTAITDFLREKVPGFEKIVQSEIEEFKDIASRMMPALTAEEKKTIRG